MYDPEAHAGKEDGALSQEKPSLGYELRDVREDEAAGAEGRAYTKRCAN